MTKGKARTRAKEFLRRALKVQEAVRHLKTDSPRLSDFEIYARKLNNPVEEV